MKKGILKHEKPRLKLGMIGAATHGSTSLTSAIDKSLARNKTHESSDIYDALVLVGPDRTSATHARVVAESIEDAKKLLECEYGKGAVYSLWNREQANKPR